MDKDAIMQQAYDMLKIMLGKDKHTHTEIINNAEKVLNMLSCQDKSVLEAVVIRYEENHPLTSVEAPDILLADEKDVVWFDRKTELIKHSMKDGYFARYKRYLRREDFSETVIQRMEVDCAKVLKYCANPDMTMNMAERKKKGLVVGDVQSGKTANYLGLINLACDYGYKIVVLLAGLTDSLRQQTQGRIDSGFIGAVSDTIGGSDITYIGVSDDDQVPHHYAVPLTNNENDFVKFVKKNLNATSGDFNKPIVLVVKKNASVLNQVVDWLKPGKHNISCDNVLIIDDEADNASINTKKPEELSPSVINGHIRNLFNNFPIASYVGYTATPFANIFVNPEDDDSYKDLFPSDFIVLLNSPSNYFGALRVFAHDGKVNSRHLRLLNEKEENFLPVKHKSGEYCFYILPDSLKEAIMCFLINNVIRTIRGAENKHRSMMINISVLNYYHDQIYNAVNEYIQNLQRVIDQDDWKDTADFIKNADMRLLYDTYTTDDFYNEIRKEISWEEIKAGLANEIDKFVVAVINNRYKKELRFDYKNYSDTGARVIAIGGYVLSRGLTLEGLMVSYFSRNSTAYDSLLQMCRWFGYRPKYDDLCRIYISPVNIMNFRAVIEAVEDLKIQFREMALRKQKPSDFGLMVKESPDTLNTSLVITSRNKMYNSGEIIRVLNYGGTYADTSKLYDDKVNNARNIEETEKMIAAITDSGIDWEDVKIPDGHTTRHMLRGVDKSFIAKYIKRLRVPLENTKFDVDNLADYIEKSSAFPVWDVVVACGDSDSTVRFFGQRLAVRTFRKRLEDDILRIGDTNNRLIDPNIFNSGLEAGQIERVKQHARKRVEETGKGSEKSLTATDYLSIKERNPLFVIYPIELKAPEKDLNDEKRAVDNLSGLGFVLGYAVGFPRKETSERMRYRANKVKIDNIQKNREEPEEDSEYDDD